MRVSNSIIRLTGFVLLASSVLHAVQETALIGALPAPGQSQRARLTQVTDMTLTPAGPAPPGFPDGGLTVAMTSTIVLRQTVGQPDADGRVRFDMTYESMTQRGTINGSEMPFPPSATQALDGTTLTLWIDAANQIADVTVPAGLGLTTDQARQMFAPLFAALPRQELRVGQTVTRPLSVTMPIPGPGGQAPTLSATTTMTLAKITGTAPTRIAVLDTTVEGTLDAAAPGAASGATMKMTGTGTTELDLGSGFVIAGTSTTSLEGTMAMPGTPPGSAALAMRGTFTLTLERFP